MRIAKISLNHYGRFAAHSTEFAPSTAVDATLVVGPNEAGKTTLRRAIGELLYGIKQGRHTGSGADMEISARLEHEGQALELRRLKKQKNPITDMAGKALEPSALAPFIGGTPQDQFLQYFSVGHDELREGGAAMADPTSSAGQALFQAASGLQAIASALKDLDAAADAVWGPRHSSTRRFSAAETRYEKAKKDLRAVRLKASAWELKVGEAARANAAVTAARLAVEALEARSESLSRATRAAPLVAALDRALSEYEALPPSLDLPDDSDALLAQYRSQLEAARGDVERARQEEADATGELGALPPRSAILDVESILDELSADVRVYQAAAGDLPAAEAQVERLERQLAEECASIESRIGDARDPETISARLPTDAQVDAVRAAVKALRQAVQERGALEATIKTAAREAAAAADALAQTQPPACVDELRVLRGEAERRLRDPDRLAVRANARQAAEASAAAASALGLTPNDLAAVAARSVAPEPELAQAAVDAQEAQKRQDEATKACSAQRAQIASWRAEAAALRSESGALTDADLETVRAHRNSVWGQIKSDHSRIEMLAEPFEKAVLAADVHADKRLSAATAAAQLASLLVRIAGAEQGLPAMEEAVRAAQRHAEVLSARQAERCAAAGVERMSEASLGAWAARRTVAIAAAARALEARSAQLEAEATDRALAGRILEKMGRTVAGVAISLEAAEALARDALEQNAKDAATYKALQEAARLAKVRESGIQADLELRDLAARDVERALDRALSEAGLAESQAPDRIESVLATVDRVRAALHVRASIIKERCAPMRLTRERFERAVNDLAAGSGQSPPLNADEYVRYVTKQAATLSKAKEAESTRESISRRLEGARVRRRKAEDEARALSISLGPLFEAARTDNLAEAALAVHAWMRRQRAAQAAGAARDSLLAAGDGLDEARLRRLATSESPEARATQRREIDEALVGAKAEFVAAVTQHAHAKSALEELGASDAAARHDADRQAAVSEMSDAAEDYVALRVQHQLLSRALDRYRESAASAVMQKACEYFKTLTCGEYERIAVDDFENPQLVVRARDGREVSVRSGILSDGTRDQLYLALRLAALEERLEAGHRMPVIADDLFINFDDKRAEAGFAALARLARLTQVIYFSHHPHLEKLAARTGWPAAVNV